MWFKQNLKNALFIVYYIIYFVNNLLHFIAQENVMFSSALGILKFLGNKCGSQEGKVLILHSGLKPRTVQQQNTLLFTKDAEKQK